MIFFHSDYKLRFVLKNEEMKICLQKNFFKEAEKNFKLFWTKQLLKKFLKLF